MLILPWLLSGNSSEYDITREDGKVTVPDKIEGRDGTDMLSNIETLQFKNKQMKSQCTLTQCWKSLTVSTRPMLKTLKNWSKSLVSLCSNHLNL